MQSSPIYKKLQIVLNENITNEQQVVYIFSKIRKLLEVNNLKNQYLVLNLFCNWILHGKLNYNKTKKYFQSMFETEISDGLSTNSIGEKILICRRHFFTLNELRIQLSTFLEKEGLSNTIVTRPAWTKFMGLLLEILMECPVIIGGDRIFDLSIARDKDGEYIYRFHLKKNPSSRKNIIKIKLKLF